MGKYTRTMAESLSMVHEVTNMDLMRKAAGGAMQTLKMKDGKVQMDSFTASAIMQIYDKVNDKNKKTMENMLKTGRRADIMKLQKFAMSKINAEYVPEELDEQLEEKIDPADVDDDATEDDIKSADKNIMMQMRKVQSLRGRYAVEFMDGKKVKVDPKIAMAVQDKYMKMRRPAEKEMFQSKVARSYKDMLSALKESLVQEGTWKVPETKIDQMALRKTLRKPIKAKDAEKVMSQHIGDDELYDEFYELEKDDPNQDVRPLIRNRMKELGIKEEVELQEKPADFIRLTFNSPADVKKAKKWMDQNLPGADQGFTGMDASGKDIEFEDVDDAEDLMDQLKKAGFRFKMDYREEVKIDELSIADVRKGTAKAKKRQGRERRTTGKTSTSTADLAARIKAKEEVELDEKENSYTVVHVKKGKEVVKAKSSYEAAKKFAQMKGLKNTSGVDAHLMEEVELGEARQLKDPKKEMMVKSKDSGVIVIDKKDFKKYQKKGYFQVEGFASDAQRRAAFASGYKEKGKKGKKESILDRIDKKLKERKNG